MCSWAIHTKIQYTTLVLGRKPWKNALKNKCSAAHWKLIELQLFILTVEKQNPDFDSGVSGGEGNEIDLDQTNGSPATGKPSSGIESNHTPPGNEVFIMDNRGEDRTASFFAQPGILAGNFVLLLHKFI